MAWEGGGREAPPYLDWTLYERPNMKLKKTLWAILLWPCCGIAAQIGTAGTFQWGVNGHSFSQEAYWQVPVATQLELVSELGATWYRFDLSFEGFVSNTERMDGLLSAAEQRKLRLLPVLCADPSPRAEEATTEQIRKAAFTFARQVASRYKGRITHWELDNELDAYAMIRKGERCRSGRLWEWDDAEGSNPDDFNEARYQKTKAEILGLHEGVKAGDPDALTIVDTSGWLHYGFIERLVKEDRVPFDILAWHWYSECGEITNVQGRLNLVEYLKRFNKPLWITEANRRDGSKHLKEQEQADYVGRTARQLSANPGITAFFIYELLDEPYFGTGGESDYGLVSVARDSAGAWQVSRKKPAFNAFKSAIETPASKGDRPTSPKRPSP